jgi:hypothetical protein
MIKNGKIVIEVEKDKENASVRVENLSLWDICNVMGAALNNIIIDNTDSKKEEVLFKVCAMRDICSQIGLTETAEILDEILGENLNDD